MPRLAIVCLDIIDGLGICDVVVVVLRGERKVPTEGPDNKCTARHCCKQIVSCCLSQVCAAPS